jgi:signal transduction histidine kinase/DNA-binding NarL/FixJ family response regulator
LAVTAHLGAFGPLAQAFSALIAMGVALLASPLIAWATGGRYYIARTSPGSPAATDGGPRRCVICERDYEGPDMAHCPAYQGPICSLCCTLDARCGDLCKPQASLAAQWTALLRRLLPRRFWPALDRGLGQFVMVMLVIAPLLAAVFALLYQQELRTLVQTLPDAALLGPAAQALRLGFLKAYLALLVLACLVAWWAVLTQTSRQVAQQESNRQTRLLLREIDSHRQTDAALQQARQVADAARQAADQANQAKSRYISAVSHELRTPLNSILGYAQLMGEDAAIPPHRKQAVAVIKRGGEHLLSLIEGTLDMAGIESGKITLQLRPMHFARMMQEVASLFELQAQNKGLEFVFEEEGALPEVVRADERRLRQILINLLGNAIKFTHSGRVTLRVRHAREMAFVDVQDTGPGLSEQEQARIFEPFSRGAAPGGPVPGAGLGLTIARMLTDLMGGELSLSSAPGQGATFHLKLFLPEVHAPASGLTALPKPARARLGYAGARRRLLVVDNEETDRELLLQVLQPLGFEVRTAASGHDCLDLLASGYRPDAILLDLAMPGIDGWETLRRLRALGGGRLARDVAVAIVSANAFDRALDHDVDLPAEDFIVKPLRHAELLDWLERRLGLQWLDTPTAPAQPPATKPPQPAMAPAAEDEALHALREAARLGYYRGLVNTLDDLAQRRPDAALWVAELRALASQFRFEDILARLA